MYPVVFSALLPWISWKAKGRACCGQRCWLPCLATDAGLWQLFLGSLSPLHPRFLLSARCANTHDCAKLKSKIVITLWVSKGKAWAPTEVSSPTSYCDPEHRRRWDLGRYSRTWQAFDAYEEQNKRHRQVFRFEMKVACLGDNTDSA